VASLYHRYARAMLRRRGYRSRHITTTVGDVHALEADGHGELPPMVFLHGLSAAGVQFGPLLNHLRGRVRRVIAPDAPAHGFSALPEQIDTEHLSAGLFEALDALIDEPVVLFGNSMGGLGAIRYALQRPEKVRALVLCSPGGAAMSESELAELLRRFDIQNQAEALDFIDGLFAEDVRFKHAIAFGLRRAFNTDTMQRLRRSIVAADLLTPDEVASIPQPTLLFWGEAEGILPRMCFEFFEANLPAHAQIETPHNFGHSPQLEHPRHLSKRIVQFVSELGEPQG